MNFKYFFFMKKESNLGNIVTINLIIKDFITG